MASSSSPSSSLSPRSHHHTLSSSSLTVMSSSTSSSSYLNIPPSPFSSSSSPPSSSSSTPSSSTPPSFSFTSFKTLTSNTNSNSPGFMSNRATIFRVLFGLIVFVILLNLVFLSYQMGGKDDEIDSDVDNNGKINTKFTPPRTPSPSSPSSPLPLRSLVDEIHPNKKKNNKKITDSRVDMEIPLIHSPSLIRSLKGNSSSSSSSSSPSSSNGEISVSINSFDWHSTVRVANILFGADDTDVSSSLSSTSLLCQSYGLQLMRVDSLGSICSFQHQQRQSKCCQNTVQIMENAITFSLKNDHHENNNNNNVSDGERETDGETVGEEEFIRLTSWSADSSSASSSSSPSSSSPLVSSIPLLLFPLSSSPSPSPSSSSPLPFPRCVGCHLAFSCCESIEYCIQCCMKGKIQNIVGGGNSSLTTYNHHDQSLSPPHFHIFDQCLSECRTSSKSIIHGNHYKYSHLPFCFQDGNENENESIRGRGGEGDEENNKKNNKNILIENKTPKTKSLPYSSSPTFPFPLSVPHVIVVGKIGESCSQTCELYGNSTSSHSMTSSFPSSLSPFSSPSSPFVCFEPSLHSLNSCEYMKSILQGSIPHQSEGNHENILIVNVNIHDFPTECTCEDSSGSDQPAILIKGNSLSPSPSSSSSTCLLNSNDKLIDCDGHHESTHRVCPCVMNRFLQAESHQ